MFCSKEVENGLHACGTSETLVTTKEMTKEEAKKVYPDYADEIESAVNYMITGFQPLVKEDK